MHSIAHRIPGKSASINVAMAKGKKLSQSARRWLATERPKAKRHTAIERAAPLPRAGR